MKNISTIIFFVIFCANLFAQEPSAFKVNDIDERDPHGLSTTEQYILKNKKKIKRINFKIEELNKKLTTISSLFLETTSQLKQDLKISNKKIQMLEARLQNDLIIIQNNLTNKIDNNTNNAQKLRQIFIELTQLTKSINESYVSKDDLSQKLSEIKNLIKKQKATKVAKTSFAKIKSSQLMSKGEKLFSTKKYTDAKNVFNQLLKRNYRPARNSYYLAEIYFVQKKYKKALNFYKKSATLYQKAKYMPNLLLHSGMSSAYTKKTENAKKFYKSLVKNYPKSKEAKEAKRILAKKKYL